MKAYGGKEYDIEKMNRRDEFEMVADLHPDVPFNIRMKADALRRGVTFSQACIEKLQDPTKYDLVMSIEFQWHQMDNACNYQMPYHFHLDDWSAICIRVSPPENNPYVLDLIDDRFYICWEEGVPITEIWFDGPAKLAGVILPNGVPCEMMVHFGGDQFYMVPTHHCGYWNTDDQCRFCDIDYFSKHLMKMGRHFKTKQTPEDVYLAVSEVMNDEGRWKTMFFNSGSDPRENYIRDIDYNVEIIDAITRAARDKIGVYPFPCYLLMAPQPKDQLQRLYDAGLRSFGSYIETWNKDQWPLVCPGKHKNIGRDEWIKRTIEAVDVFGKGNVGAGFVLGVDMAPPPYGWEDVEDAVPSTLEGFSFFIDNHVVPVSTNWAIEPGTVFYRMGAKQPPLEYFIRVDKGRFELLKNYQKKHGYGISGDFLGKAQPQSCYADYQRLL